MEGLETKLQSENPAFIAQVFSDIYKNISKNKNEKMYLYLKNKCMVSNTIIQETAQSTILMLIQNGKYDVTEILADFITNISTSSNTLPLTKMIFYLICVQIKVSSSNKQIKYKLVQHPIIKILQCNSTFDIQLSIYKDIVNCYNSRSSEQLKEILYPLYLYCLCNPNLKPEIFFLRDNLWSHILNISQHNKFLTCKILAWMQIQNDNISEVSAILLNKALDSLNMNSFLNDNEINDLVAVQLLICCNLIQSGRDCRLFLRTLKQFIVASKSNTINPNIYLPIISKAITVCSPLFIKDLLELCHVLINNNCNIINYFSIKSSLLLWLTTPSLLTRDCLLIAKNILKMENLIYKNVFHIANSRQNLEYMLLCNPTFFLSKQLEQKMINVHENHHFLLTLLKQLNKNLDFSIKKDVLSLICKCSLHYTNLLPIVFSNLLYHLSNTRDNRLLFELLKTLPLMVHEKENIQKVIVTIQTIGNQSMSLNAHARYLMYKIWEIDSSCYSNLEALLLQGKKSLDHDNSEEIISKAFIINMIAQKRPELHGRELIPHISKILNEYTDSAGAIPCSLVIDSIKYLCKAEVIDIIRTWTNLSPKFTNESRIPVIKSICSLLREIPTFSYTESDDELNNEVIRHLWKYVIGNDNEEVISVALKALSRFSLECICLNMPNEFLDEEKHPQNITSFDQTVVSGKTWIKFLRNCKYKEAAVNFLIELVSDEINKYLKFLYQVKKQREPDSFEGLPTNSIVNVLAQYIKRNREKINGLKEDENKDVFIDCMKILSKKYSKPLPPFNWCFLQELIHNPELKRFCIDIACHQIILSGSARRLVENYIVALTETKNIQDCLLIYRNLKCIANSIQPVILKPFVEYSVQYAFTDFKTESLLVKILDYLKSVLDDADIQNCNKKIIEDVLTELLLLKDFSSASFGYLLDCVTSFSESSLELITRYNMIVYEEKEFMKITKIRCKIACSGKDVTPLKWLNDVFTIASKNNIRLDLYMGDICECIIQNINQPHSPSWVMELFGQIQAQVADRCEPKEIQYFCDILSIVIVYFSGMFTLLPEDNYNVIKYFFPASITFLLNESLWTVTASQVLEWLHYMSLVENISQEYKNIFVWSLCCLRHNEEFLKNGIWMKYIDCEIPINTIKL